MNQMEFDMDEGDFPIDNNMLSNIINLSSSPFPNGDDSL